MALGIYRQVSPGIYSIYKEYGSVDDTLPIRNTFDGILGENVHTLLYVRNDDNSRYYENIKVQPISLVTPSQVDNVSTGHGMKLIAGSTQPTEAQWEATDYANQISLSDLGVSGSADTTSYLPFWCRIECPAGAAIDNLENTTLRVSSDVSHI